ncbi:MAG: hypothetical protein II625_05065 [Bacilli bacterium]|nr:hypothetical protein [Bacilli bacterium]
MKKIIDIVKKNWFFLLLVIPFVSICIVNRFQRNDTWFLLNCGRYVFGHGIPHVDPFTIHEGLNYVMQQWLTSVVFYGIFKVLGKYGLLYFTLLMSIVLMVLYYRLCYLVSKNKLLSILITAIVFYMSSIFIILRPQLFTYLLLIIEVICLEKYVVKSNWKYLIPLPFLSILLINFHASMWLFLFIFILPFMVEGIINLKKKSFRIKPLIIVSLIMFVCGFINPYGWNGITYIFKSYNIPEISELVEEMKSIQLDQKLGKYLIFSIFAIVLLLNYVKKNKLCLRHLFFIVGTALLAFMHYKCFVYFALFGLYSVPLLIKELKFDIKLNNKYFVSLIKGLTIGLSCLLVVTFVYTVYQLHKNYKFEESSQVKEVTDYIIDNYDKDEVILFVDYDYGGYTEYRGLKSYLDPRAELFSEKLNGKENILKEALILENATDDYYEKFLTRYNFTHLIVSSYLDNFIAYLKKSDDYVLEYEQSLGNNVGNVTINYLFVKKDISIKEK